MRYSCERSGYGLMALMLTVITLGTLVIAQDDKDEIPLKAPKGWSGETIKLPPGFARDMKLRGIEVIRFAPGCSYSAAGHS